MSDHGGDSVAADAADVGGCAPSSNRKTAMTTKNPAASSSDTNQSASCLLSFGSRSNIDSEWLRQFRLLEQFKEVTGHTNVPNDGTSLYRWLIRQHVEYTNFIDILEGNTRDKDQVSTSFNEEKLMLLRRLGFVFRRKTAGNSARKRLDTKRTKFDIKFDLLKEFRKEYGHIDVPQNIDILNLSKEDEAKYRSLGPWLTYMRMLLRKTQAQKNNNDNIDSQTDNSNSHSCGAGVLSPERVQRLDDIGVTAFVPNRGKGKKRAALQLLHRHEQRQDQEEEQEGGVVTQKRRRTVEERWDARFEEMKKFTEEHGHCVVPVKKEYAPLRGWLDKVRKEYKKLQAGFESDELTAIRLQRLADIGFQFQAKKSKTFEERFQQWVEYREGNNGKDPLRFGGDGLGTWISKIRSKKLLYDEGKPCNLTPEQIQRLDEKGFVWSVLKKRPELKHPRVKWHVRFEDLKKFKEKHGHTSVPQNTPGLGSWVHKQRVKFWEIKRGKEANNSKDLTPDKIEKLNALGFEWVSRQRQPQHALRHTPAAMTTSPPSGGDPGGGDDANEEDAVLATEDDDDEYGDDDDDDGEYGDDYEEEEDDDDDDEQEEYHHGEEQRPIGGVNAPLPPMTAAGSARTAAPSRSVSRRAILAHFPAVQKF